MRILALIFVALLSVAAPAQAQGPVYGKPMYDPASKSYFELVKVAPELAPGFAIPSLPWDKALQAASGRSFKNTKGRLAIVRSLETHMFILENLRPPAAAWIGLRYLCKSRKLVWSNGEYFKPGDFQAWDTKWDHSGNAGCVNQVGEGDWMSVTYTPANQGFRWIALGNKKIYTLYLVEYPTGRP